MSTFNQGTPSVPTVITSSNVYLFGASVGNALTVQQLGTGNVFSTQTASGATSLFVAGSGNVGVGTTKGTETLTVSGNTSFVGSVTVTSDVSGAGYVNARRVPAGSLQVSNYVTGSVPLTTTTNLIQNYLSNAATVSTAGVGGYGPALNFPGTTSSWVGIPNQTATKDGSSSCFFIETWFYVSAATNTTAPVVQFADSSGNTNDQFTMSLTKNVNNFRLRIYAKFSLVNIDYTDTTDLTPGTWYYWAVSLNPVATNPATLGWRTSGGVAQTTNYGGSSIGSGQSMLTTTTNYLWLGGRNYLSELFNGFIYDVRICRGGTGIIPNSGIGYVLPSGNPFTFGSSLPNYPTGGQPFVATGGKVHFSLRSQYFPGASTSPYGPCLTLPGTSNSYYSYVNTAFDTNWKTNGFCLEAWVNYASLANSNVYNAASIPLLIGHYAPTGASTDWGFGATTTGQLAFWYYNGAGQGVTSSTGALVTGQWTHVVVQSNGTNIWLAVNGTFVSGAGTAISGTPVVTAGTALTVGQLNNNTGPNFAIAKARLTFGTSGSPSLGNVYSSGNFTPNPNFATVPAGATVAWSLDTQYPLPTYPSIQDVTQLSPQSTSYGSLPTPVGGVTSNVLGPFSTTYPQLDSIRFDGTGYIDYGNAASSVMTTNLWANAWTIEAWVYPTNLVAGYPNIITRLNYADVTNDWIFFLAQTTGAVSFAYGGVLNVSTLAAPLNTWTHIAATYDGVRSNVYVGGVLSNSMTATTTAMLFTPTRSVAVGTSGFYNLNGNLADVRVSNVARYTDSSYTVPTAPFATDSSTLLLLKSLAGQVGTTLEIQGRGLGSTSIGASQTVRAYPPAPMSSYLLDTTSNTSVTYGQGKYIASASSEYTGQPPWLAFDGNPITAWGCNLGYTAGTYTGTVTTVDVNGNSYSGEWIQVQMPVSVILSSYSLVNINNTYQPTLSWMLGSRDGINWTLVFKYSGPQTGASSSYTVSATQGYNYYRLVVGSVVSANATNMYSYVLNGTEEALCVTADSKVGVGIANPQRTLEVAGDLVVGGTISGGAGMGQFRNRIINGDMRIAQRGTSNVMDYATTPNPVYVIDRFKTFFSALTSGNLTITQSNDVPADPSYYFANSVTCTVNSALTSTSATAYFLPFWTIFENYNVVDFNWGTLNAVPVTLSFWFKASVVGNYCVNFRGPARGSVYGYSTVFPVYNSATWEYKVLTIPPFTQGVGSNGLNGIGLELIIGSFAGSSYSVPQNGTWVSIGGNNLAAALGTYVNWYSQTGNYIKLTGIQLEKGTVATPFEFRPYATELALCQRYFTQLGGQMLYNYFGTGVAYNASGVYMLCPLNVPMRLPSASTVSVLNVGNINLLGNVSGFYGSTVLSAIAKDQHNVNNIELIVTSSVANLTTNFPYMMYSNNSTVTFIQINNEL